MDTAQRPAMSPPRRRRWIRRLLVGVVVSALILGATVGWRAWNTRAQGSPQAVEFADAVISPTLSGATVLALGEATHGNAELQRLRLTLVRRLPQFKAIVFEDDHGSVARVNEYVQGGPGTAEDAARRFGFVLNHTAEMAELLQWIHDHNSAIPAQERIHLIGMDVQRIDASKELALDWLDQQPDSDAAALREALHGWTDETRLSDDADQHRAEARPAVDRLVAAIEANPEAAGRQAALDAATALSQQLELADAAGTSYAQVRAEIMAENLARTVEQQRARGNEHTLLFAHNGHVDSDSAAFAHRDLGELAAERWGDRYRVIGTEVHHSRLMTGQREHRWEVTLDNPTPLRGIFAGTDQGYLEMSDALPENRELLERPVRMASAGEDFHTWQAWLPWLNSVKMVPATSYDALILIDQAGPVTPLN